MENENLVTRFAPSPTGKLHVGGVHTALFNYLLTKKKGGKFFLRIEDTDKERSKKEFEDDIFSALEWLNIEFDGEVVRQSERVDIHKKYLLQLIDEGKAYVSKEEPKKEGQSSEVIRFKNPGEVVTFKDEIRGDVTFDTTELGDFVIAKNLDTPLFHLAVVVDDHDMGVNYIMRGEDHISNTPRQILIYKALGFDIPQYAHLPLIFGSDGKKLSKRHGALPASEYKELGYLSSAMINFLVLIGWNPGDEREVFSFSELVNEFSVERVQKGGGVFNIDKLDWLNKQHIKNLSEDEIFSEIKKTLSDKTFKLSGYSDDKLRKVQSVILERVKKFTELEIMEEEGEIAYYFEQPEYEAESLLWKKDPSKENTAQHLDKVIIILSKIQTNDWNNDIIKEAVFGYAEEVGRGNVLWPMRYALSGRDRSPDPITLAQLLGKEESVKRLTHASSILLQ